MSLSEHVMSLNRSAAVVGGAALLAALTVSGSSAAPVEHPVSAPVAAPALAVPQVTIAATGTLVPAG